MGLSMFEGTFQVAVPELAGTIAPTVVGSQEKVKDPETGLTIVVRKPIAVAGRDGRAARRRVRGAARPRRIATSASRSSSTTTRPGKANIGASYLNVAESLANILQRLKQEGYDVGDGDLSGDAVLQTLHDEGAQRRRLRAGRAARRWSTQGSAVARQRRRVHDAGSTRSRRRCKAKILKDWGAPAKTRLMTDRRQPRHSRPCSTARSRCCRSRRAAGARTPRRCITRRISRRIISTSRPMRGCANGFKADAVVHIGTHGTLEWLDGKDIGLSDEDAPDALIADLPDLYIYNVDVVGEGLVARRRGMATLVDHMVPPFKKGGLYPELAALGETINDYDTSLHKNPELAKAVGEQIRAAGDRARASRRISASTWRSPTASTDEAVHQIQDHLLRAEGAEHSVRAARLRPRAGEAAARHHDRRDRQHRSQPAAEQAKVLAGGDGAAHRRVGARELDSLMRGAARRLRPGGSGGEPIRNPDSYPTGKNFYGIDPDKVPKPASCEHGRQARRPDAGRSLKKHGKYPEKVSFVIWGDETMRHEGVLESQIFHLLGTKPVWNERGKVVDVEVIPRAQLGRPRVDIVIASRRRGHVQQRHAADGQGRPEGEGARRGRELRPPPLPGDEGDRSIAARLHRGRADRRAGVRIFDEPPGTFNLNTSTIVAASGTWDTDKGMADDYLRKLGHGYGNGFWGEPMEDVFRLALSGTEKIVHSSSTMLYGALDNDDMFMYMGGLATAIRNIDGRDEPEMVVTNTRDPGKPEMTSIDKFIGTEFRSRYVNPTWIEGMKKEGYAGAGEMRSFVEYLWGWDATRQRDRRRRRCGRRRSTSTSRTSTSSG